MSHMDIQTDRRMVRSMDRQDGQVDGQTGWSGQWTDGWSGRWTDGWSGHNIFGYQL